MKSDTPETDAALESAALYEATMEGLQAAHEDGKQLFQKMERERNEARAALENLADAICQYGGGASMMHPRITRAISAARKITSEND